MICLQCPSFWVRFYSFNSSILYCTFAQNQWHILDLRIKKKIIKMTVTWKIKHSDSVSRKKKSDHENNEKLLDEAPQRGPAMPPEQIPFTRVPQKQWSYIYILVLSNLASLKKAGRVCGHLGSDIFFFTCFWMLNQENVPWAQHEVEQKLSHPGIHFTELWESLWHAWRVQKIIFLSLWFGNAFLSYYCSKQ